MLVTTAQTEGTPVKIGNRILTFYFPTTLLAPGIEVDEQTVIIGRQQVTIENGNLALKLGD